MKTSIEKLINEAIDEVLGKSDEVKKAYEKSKTDLYPPPTIVETFHKIGFATSDGITPLLAAILKELRNLRAVVDELKGEKK